MATLDPLIDTFPRDPGRWSRKASEIVGQKTVAFYAKEKRRKHVLPSGYD